VVFAVTSAEDPDSALQSIPQPGSLTEREREVAFLTANGMDREKIAESLFVSRHTVEKHLADAFAKLGVTSVAELSEWFKNEVVLRATLAASGDRSRYRFPRLACSRSIASNSAWKLPLPKPRLP
jgi:DNA-binding CsgD family transcriptional regulator